MVCVLMRMMRIILRMTHMSFPSMIRLSLWLKVVSVRRIINVFMQQSIQWTVGFFIIVVLINWLEEGIKVRVVVRFMVHRLVIKQFRVHMLVLRVLSRVNFVAKELV